MEPPSSYGFDNQTAVLWSVVETAPLLSPYLLLGSLAIAYIFYAAASSERGGGKAGGEYPPYAPGGVWAQTVTRLKIRGPEAAYWLLDIAREIRSSVFRLRLPVIFPPHDLYVVGDLEAFRPILLDPNARKPETFYALFRGVYGGTRTVFTSNDGQGHHAKRKAVAPAFSSRHIKRMTRVAIEKTERWMERTLKMDESFDPSKEMISIVLGALSETAFEYEMSEEEKEFFGQELTLALIEFMRKMPVIPLRGNLGWLFPSRRRAILAAKNLKDMAIRIMEEYKEKEDRVEGTIIELVMDSKAFPTDDEKASQLLEFLIAGHDTTAYSIAFILLELARNPAEQTKLRNALKGIPSDEWSHCPELQRVVKEGMRLHPVGRSLRVARRDIRTKNGRLIPRGSNCIAHFLMMFRNQDVFDEPDSFIPSRWENPTSNMVNALTPFSAGRQNCVGQSLARAEIYCIVARVCSEFELTMEREGIVEFFLSMKPMGSRLRARRVQRDVENRSVKLDGMRIETL